MSLPILDKADSVFAPALQSLDALRRGGKA